MLRPRIIPCLLISDKGLVKTEKFKNPKYLGDPINAVRIFNEKEVDELIMLDIDASILQREPDYKSIEYWASECRMPLCYGGGIKTVEQALTIFSLGVEKIAISSAAVNNPRIIKDIADRVGSQSVVVVIDYKKKIIRGKEVFIYNGKKSVRRDPISIIKEVIDYGAGEIVLNSIDLDGTMIGYDYSFIRQVNEKINVPMTVMGGAGKLEDIEKLINDNKIIGAGAGSLFVFKGKYRAVLINYPDHNIREKLIDNCILVK